MNCYPTGKYHWSNCAYSVRFFKINPLAGLFWLLLIFIPNWFMFCLTISLNLALIYIEIYLKMSIFSFFRLIKILLLGRFISINESLKNFRNL